MKRSIKAYVACFLACLLIVSGIMLTAADRAAADERAYGVRIMVDGVELDFAEDMRPFIVDGRTFMSADGFTEARRILGGYPMGFVEIVQPLIEEGQAFLPLHYIAEALGWDISWDGETSTVYIGWRPTRRSAGTDLIVTTPYMPASLDPASSTSIASDLVNRQIYSTLVMLDYETMEIMPGLAVVWDVPDAQTIHMELRRNVVFHNGYPLTAHDVQFSLEHAAVSEGAFHFASMIESITVHDDYNFTIHLEIPFAPILKHLASPAMGIISANHNFFYHHTPIGTGPFMLAQDLGDTIVLERNPYYWGDVPQVENLVILEEGDRFTQLLMIEAGEADIALNLFPESIAFAEASSYTTIMRRPNLTMEYIGFNLSREPFDNPLVARAINYAIDTQDIIDIVYYGIGKPVASPMSPLVWGYADIAPFEANPERARELLAEAGYPDGFGRPIELRVRDFDVQGLKTAQIVQLALAPLGIDVEIHVLEWVSYLESRRAGYHDMFIDSWAAVTGDADYALKPLFHSSNHGIDNRTFHSNPALDTLLEQGRMEVDPTTRAAIYAEVLELLREHPPTVPIRQEEHIVAVYNNLRGFTLSPAGYHRFCSVYFVD